MATPKLSTLERAITRAQVAALTLQGKGQSEIAQELGMTQQMVSYYLGKVRAAWLEASVRDYADKVYEEVAKIDHTESQAWVAFNKSKEPRTVQRITHLGGKSPRDVFTVIKVPAGAGDAKFLRIVLECIALRCKLLGLDGGEAPSSAPLAKVYLLPSFDV